jgi:predicted dithiol-disulfide oxidoreductase (DUF899 family)
MLYDKPGNRIREIENAELVAELEPLRRNSKPEPVKNYLFRTLEGEATLSELFAGKDGLILIHNMGQGCRWCTTWADGINAFLPHLEDRLSVVLVSKDPPDVQRRFANSRGWRFRTASHGGGDYILEQSVVAGETNMPGIASYVKEGGKIFRKNCSAFGPGDLFCSLWHILSLAGIGVEDFTPQYS